MINFVTIDTLIKDLLFIIRASKVSQSETISWNQIEYWIHQYRALLIKQDLDKNKMPNPDYIQEIACLKLISEDKAGSTSLQTTGEYIYRTEIQLPKTIDLGFKSGVMYVGTLDGKEIQFTQQEKAEWQQHSKYTARDQVAYLKNQYIYIKSPYALSYIAVRGIFEIPTEINNLVNPMTNLPLFTTDTTYPIPINWIPTLKEMILRKELNIIVSSLSDDKNDSSSKVQGNVENKE